MHLADETVRELERAKWRLWHGQGWPRFQRRSRWNSQTRGWAGCRRKLMALCRWTPRKHVREVAGIARFQRHVGELLAYLERNEDALVHYAARRQRDEPISTAFIEIVAKRMNKKQQMRWNRTTVQPFLDVRTTVLNDTLEDAFRERYRGFRPANDKATTVA
jgi:hypothetical protein